MKNKNFSNRSDKSKTHFADSSDSSFVDEICELDAKYFEFISGGNGGDISAPIVGG